MAKLLIVDDNLMTVELLAELITSRLGHAVTLLPDVADVTKDFCEKVRFDLALVDLSFRGTERSGLDVLLVLSEVLPAVHLVLFTQGDDASADLMRDAWEALPLATAISKSMPVPAFLETLQRVLEHGSAPPDPVLQPLLPAQRSGWRTADGYRRLVHHAGHAKLWPALLAAGPDPSYEDLHRLSGLKINTLRNYREQLVPELALHGIHAPTIRQLQAFAKRCRPLLLPAIERTLGPTRSTRVPDPSATRMRHNVD